MHSRHLRVEIYEAFYSVAKDNISIVYLTPKKINWTSKAEDVSLHSQKPSFIQSAFRNRLMMAAEKLKQNVKGIPHKLPHPHLSWVIWNHTHMEAIMGSVCGQE